MAEEYYTESFAEQGGPTVPTPSYSIKEASLPTASPSGYDCPCPVLSPPPTSLPFQKMVSDGNEVFWGSSGGSTDAYASGEGLS